MSAPYHDRRRIYDLDYFLRGGVERRRGSWGGRAAKDRRLVEDSRQIRHSDYPGLRRRSFIQQRTARKR